MDQKIEVTIYKNKDLLKTINKGIKVKTMTNKDLLSEIRNVQKSTNEFLTEIVESAKESGSEKTDKSEGDDDNDIDANNKVIEKPKKTATKRKIQEPPNKRKTGRPRKLNK